jgi:hypothetical protein
VPVNAHLFAGAPSDTQTIYRMRAIHSDNFHCGACKVPVWRLLFLNWMARSNE